MYLCFLWYWLCFCLASLHRFFLLIFLLSIFFRWCFLRSRCLHWLSWIFVFLIGWLSFFFYSDLLGVRMRKGNLYTKATSFNCCFVYLRQHNIISKFCIVHVSTKQGTQGAECIQSFRNRIIQHLIRVYKVLWRIQQPHHWLKISMVYWTNQLWAYLYPSNRLQVLFIFKHWEPLKCASLFSTCIKAMLVGPKWS